MKSSEFINEGLNYPIICVDVQPEYAYYGNNAGTCENIIHFVNKQTGPVLMFVNAEDTGVSGDTVQDIHTYWEQVIGGEPEYDDETGDYAEQESQINWNRFTVVDKGFGYLRSWMDQGVSPAGIIKTIRMMYQQKVQDSRMLFGGDDTEGYEESMQQLLGNDWQDWMASDGISVEWISVAQLKKFSGAYLVGGGRDECLREVEIIMNAFNIRYKRIDSLVY
jgi:hypothetical protein